jgi:SNF2 family DNA or RNA helicase
LVLNLNNPDRVLAVIPTAKKMQFKGRDLVLVPHKLDEVKVLRNMGMDAPAPTDFYYDWPGQYKPFVHQKVTVDFAVMNPRGFDLNDMGAGKTLAHLWAFDYLRSIGKVKRMLVVCPLSTIERTWGDHIFTHFMHLEHAVLYGTTARRLKMLDRDADIYLINHDGLKNKQVLSALVERKDIDVVALDEVAVYRNAGTGRWKSAHKLIAGRRYVWGLTGTPTPNSPEDAWAQCRLICPERVPRYFGQWRDMVMKRISQYKWIPRADAMQTVLRVMQPAIRYSRDECLDLPPTTHSTRHVELSPEQARMYTEMLRKMKAEYEGGQMTAVNEAVKVGKLVQISCGAGYGTGTDVVIPAQNRVDVLTEIIEESEAKTIVFVPIVLAIEHLAEALKDYGFSVAVIHGDVGKSARDEIFGNFMRYKDPRVLVAQPAAMSHGLTLTSANTIVWFAPINSNDIYEQANARIVRPGQKLNTHIIHIEGTPAERGIYTRLRNKGSMQGLLLDMFKELR